ncbi:D-glycerate transporter [Indibacter alkaliphilus LW1]|uniref:D-glycerate transporter n=1 Tax=Indibacter alkaliphilus (strain CCUG 57479 / KCTC 22604 / LW1) TaxID=1189612 RepID=S2DBD4_INDAL|nr:GntP family permease [Indibacter alkaliphilus]EOZ96492.1 D-glycerate transporter [Indibacter alkaliphilus LW1]
MILILTIFLALAIILVAIVKFDIHPFLALFGTAIIYGLLAGMPGDLILQSISEGFGGVLGSIGLLILLGVIMGTFLEKTGGALVIAEKILRWIGEKSVTTAMLISGYILSIPVFGDSVFIMMNPISKSLSLKSKTPYAATTIAIALGATASHSLVPPTPGPIATAGIMEADLGMVIFWGFLISMVTLIPSYYFIKKFVTKIPLVPQVAKVDADEARTVFPSAFKSFLPITVPLVLIIIASIAKYPSKPFGEGSFYTIMQFIGSPVIALFLGVFLTFLLPKKFDKRLLSASGWFGEAILIAAPVILITGAGGVFGKMLQNSGIGEMVSANMSNASWGIFLPFIIAFSLKTAQGSSTVAMITTASIVAPLLGSLGLDSETMRVFAVLATGAGAIAISHANDSFFWAVTQLSGLTIKQGNQSHSLGTLIMSLTAISLIYLITLFV